MSAPATDQPAPSDFIRDIVAEDVRSGKRTKIHTRFPPEPNGYLHIGHTKAICLNFGIAREFGGICNVRMDDTNPEKEETEFIDSIMADIRWLIDGWADKNLRLKVDGSPLFASDYFEQIYEFAQQLVRKGKAYVCDMTPEETDEYRRLGKDGPFRNRSVEENLDLLARMKAGEFPDGARTLRASTAEALPPAGWYADPTGDEQLRYWAGSFWTEHTAGS
jgi:glutaminyl-tRNA synthetase